MIKLEFWALVHAKIAQKGVKLETDNRVLKMFRSYSKHDETVVRLNTPTRCRWHSHSACRQNDYTTFVCICLFILFFNQVKQDKTKQEPLKNLVFRSPHLFLQMSKLRNILIFMFCTHLSRWLLGVSRRAVGSLGHHSRERSARSRRRQTPDR